MKPLSFMFGDPASEESEGAKAFATALEKLTSITTLHLVNDSYRASPEHTDLPASSDNAIRLPRSWMHFP